MLYQSMDFVIALMVKLWILTKLSFLLKATAFGFRSIVAGGEGLDTEKVAALSTFCTKASMVS